MELNDLYDHLWNTGTLLQSEDACSVLENDYRPWPRVRYTEGASRHYYVHLEKSKPAALMELKQYENKSDVAVYTPILLEVLQLFGLAIHTSLERTMVFSVMSCVQIGSWKWCLNCYARITLPKDHSQLLKVSVMYCSSIVNYF